jgi:hypothetical protein
MMIEKRRLSLPMALMWILGSTFLITGSGYYFLKLSRHQPLSLGMKTPFVIKKIVQTGPHRDALKTDYLAELLELSQDHPTPLSSFDIQAGIKKLLAMPMIKQASIFVIKPDTIYIDYTLRDPIAMVYDYENIAIDEEGVLFPFSPFYSPKELPELYFGLPLLKEEETWFSQPMQGESMELAMKLLKALKLLASEEKFFLKRIDVSHAFEKSYGKQEVIVDIVNEAFGLSTKSSRSFMYHLRLSPKEYAQQLGNYRLLHQEMSSSLEEGFVDEKVIDLRMEGLAFIDGEF